MLTIIMDAQLLLNNHRMFQAFMDFYQDSIQEQVHMLSKPCKGEDPMMPTFRETLKTNFKKSLALHQKVALLLEQGFKDSTKSRKQLKFIGLRIALKDYLGMLNNHSKLYKDLGEILSEMNGLLFGMLPYCSPQEQLEIPGSIYRLTDTVQVAMVLIEGVCNFLKLMKNCCAHAQQTADSSVVRALDLLNSANAQQATLQAQEATGSTPWSI